MNDFIPASAFTIVIALWWVWLPALLFFARACGNFLQFRASKETGRVRNLVLALIAAAAIVHGTGKNSLLSGGSSQTAATATMSGTATTKPSPQIPNSQFPIPNSPSPATLRALITPENYTIGDLPAWWVATYPDHTDMCGRGCGIPQS